MADTIYVGNGKEKTFEDGGTIVNFSICLTDLPKEHIQIGKNGKKYMNLTIRKNREIDKYGNSHNVVVNTYKPAEKGVTESTSQPVSERGKEDFRVPGDDKFDGNPKGANDDLPFALFLICTIGSLIQYI